MQSVPEVPIWHPDGEIRTLQQIELDIVRLALILHVANCLVAAKHRGMSRTNFDRRMNEMGVILKGAGKRVERRGSN